MSQGVGLRSILDSLGFGDLVELSMRYINDAVKVAMTEETVKVCRSFLQEPEVKRGLQTLRDILATVVEDMDSLPMISANAFPFIVELIENEETRKYLAKMIESGASLLRIVGRIAVAKE